MSRKEEKPLKGLECLANPVMNETNASSIARVQQPLKLTFTLETEENFK